MGGLRRRAAITVAASVTPSIVVVVVIGKDALPALARPITAAVVVALAWLRERGRSRCQKSDSQ